MAIEADISGWQRSAVSRARRTVLERAVVEAYHMARSVHLDMDVIWDQDRPRLVAKRQGAWLQNERMRRFFGTGDLTGPQIQDVHARVRKIHDRLFESHYRWIVKPRQGDCETATTNAHVSGQARRIFICPAWYRRPALQRPSVLIHEIVHKLGLAGREHQGVRSFQDLEFVLDLADNDPKKARKNADTYEFLYQQYYHRVDAALWRRDNDKIYLFSGNRYTRFSPNDLSAGADSGYPRPIEGNWRGLPEEFVRGIDAAVWRDDNRRIYFFKGDQYVRFTAGNTRMDRSYPKSMRNWKGLPSRFEEGIDAALWRGDNGRLYFFKGHEYVRYSDPNKSVDRGYPKNIAGRWGNLPNDFERDLGAALWHWSAGRLYFFHGTRYVRYTDVPNSIDRGYPRAILSHWRGVPPTSPTFVPSFAKAGAFKGLPH